MRFFEIAQPKNTVEVYHGNNYGTKVITPAHMDNSINEYGVGIYFTDNKKTADTYGKYLVKATVDKSRFLNALGPVSKLGNSFVKLLFGLFKTNPEGIWYYLTDYGVEAPKPENIRKEDFYRVAKLVGTEQIRHAQQTLTNYTSVEDFVKAWNTYTNYDGLYHTHQTGETFYIIINPNIKLNLVEDNILKIKDLKADQKKAEAWIDKIYSMLPANALNNDQRAVVFNNGEEFGLFELEPSKIQPGAVEVKWFQAYPLRQGVGTKAMRYLQDLAAKDNVTLTLYPWDKGRVSQSKLTKFYKQQGFKPHLKGAKNMIWSPDKK